MKRLTVWIAHPSNSSYHNAEKTSILIEENVMQLTREDKLYQIGIALHTQKKVPLIRLLAYK